MQRQSPAASAQRASQIDGQMDRNTASRTASQADSSEAAPTAALSPEQLEFVNRLQRLYRADHQAEYLYLQAEIDSLMIQLAQTKLVQTKLAQTQAEPAAV